MKTVDRNEMGLSASRRLVIGVVAAGLVSAAAVAGVVSLSALAGATEPSPPVASAVASSLPTANIGDAIVTEPGDSVVAGALTVPRPDLYPVVDAVGAQGRWGLQTGFDDPNPALRGAVEAMTQVPSHANADGVWVTVSLADPRDAMSLFGPVVAVEVNGATGWTATDGSRAIVAWQVSSATWANVSMVGTLDQAHEFAEGVRFVPEAEWADHYSISQPLFGAAADELADWETSDFTATTVQVLGG